jgi:hypothetical protein
MADYYPLISRAVAGLEKNTGEGRRALYERARKALVDQLRGVDPPLSETDITRERLALEESIRKVETEAVRQSRPPAPPAPPPRPAPEPAAKDLDAAPPPPPPARPPQRRADPLVPPSGDLRRSERKWLNPKVDEPKPDSRDGIKGFSDVVADAENLGAAAAQAGRTARETYSSVPSPSSEFDRIEPRVDMDARSDSRSSSRAPKRPEVSDRDDDAADRVSVPDRSRGGERRPTTVRADLGPVIEDNRARSGSRVPEPQLVPDKVRQVAERARRDYDDDDDGEKKPLFGRLVKGVITIGVVLLLIVGVGFGFYKYGGKLVPLVASMFSKSQTTATKVDTSPSRNTKIPDRVGQQDQGANPQEAAVAQRVVLYEEDPSDSAGKKYTGTSLWRAETVSPAAGQPADRTVRADINIPERNMQVVWSLRRNNDKDLPASHTISIQFVLPPNFVHGGIAEIRGVLMKQAEQTRGVSLAGISVKVTNNFFLVGLSNTDTDVQRNIQMLKERQWFDIAVVYTDGRRAILAVEKGNPGDKAFLDAFGAWGQ